MHYNANMLHYPYIDISIFEPLCIFHRRLSSTSRHTGWCTTDFVAQLLGGHEVEERDLNTIGAEEEERREELAGKMAEERVLNVIEAK